MVGMILSIVFLVLFAAYAAVGIVFTVQTVRTPMIEYNYKRLFTRVGISIAGAIAFFIAASFGFYMWLGATPDAVHVIQLVLGAILFIGTLFTAINTSMGILKETYPYIINLRYKRKEVAGVDIENKIQNIETISYEDLFASFYLDQTGDELTDFQKELVEKLIKEGDNDED